MTSTLTRLCERYQFLQQIRYSKDCFLNVTTSTTFGPRRTFLTSLWQNLVQLAAYKSRGYSRTVQQFNDSYQFIFHYTYVFPALLVALLFVCSLSFIYVFVCFSLVITLPTAEILSLCCSILFTTWSVIVLQSMCIHNIHFSISLQSLWCFVGISA